jgi:hypothetical protein
MISSMMHSTNGNEVEGMLGREERVKGKWLATKTREKRIICEAGTE